MRRGHLLLAAAVLAAATMTGSVQAGSAPSTPVGLTGFAGDGSVTLTWNASSGATSYDVLRGTDPSAVSTVIASGVSDTTYADASAPNGQTAYYVVRAVSSGGTSPVSGVAGATPQAASCSSGNAIVVENCFPGTTNWKTQGALQASNGGIEGYATEASINAGQAVDIKVNTATNGVPFHIEIYRSGWYGGKQGRLVSTLPGLTADAQPPCTSDPSTGFKGCSNWATAATITTTSSWPSGVYLLRLVRDDASGADNHVLLVVRHDSSHSSVLYGVPTATYQAYNNYGGKSLYEFNSTGAATVAGTTRAVRVSFDRPYQQSVTGQTDWYTTVDVRNVGWLEQQGYDVAYTTSDQLDAQPSLVADHRAFVSPSHDEYWSAPARAAVTAARDAGTSIDYLGSNEDYWKVRFEANAAGASRRVLVCYKTVQGGVPDPSGDPTTTWRDPNGPNQPENGLAGQMYIGDNGGVTFRLRVDSAQGSNPFWRHTSVANLAAGASAAIGTSTVGWEWDGRYANGAEPPGLTTLSATAVSGSLIQDAGATFTTGSATAMSTIYQADSGALVFSSGTNNWSRGLGVNMGGSGEPNADIGQATMNLLTDEGVAPTTPAAGMTPEDVSALTVAGHAPASNATAVSAGTTVTARLSLPAVPSTVSGTTFTLTGPNGAVPATVAYDRGARTATLTPSAPLAASTTYTATLTSATTVWGAALGAPVTWSFTTDAAPVLRVTAQTPADGAPAVSAGTAPTATFSLAVDPSTVTTSSFTLTGPNGAVPAAVTVDATARKATLTPSAPLARGATFTATLATSIQTSSGVALANPVTWSFTTAQCPCSLFPASLLPAKTKLPVRDGRSGAGPFSYEMGVKVRVAAPMQLTAVRYYRDVSETGTHTGRIWSSAGTLLASVPFANETSSGWQQASLPTPITLQPGQTYVVSVGLNATFVMTNLGLQTQIVNGDLSTDVTAGKNGVYGSASGVFPTASYQSSNYFVDVVAQ